MISYFDWPLVRHVVWLTVGLLVTAVAIALLLTAAISVLAQNPWNLGGSPWASTLLFLVVGIGMLLLPTWSYRRVAGEDIKASLP